jgi:hypothetical protein
MFFQFEGYKNNVIKVQKADFDAFEALDMDSAAVAKAAAHKRQQQVTIHMELIASYNASVIQRQR